MIEYRGRFKGIDMLDEIFSLLFLIILVGYIFFQSLNYMILFIDLYAIYFLFFQKEYTYVNKIIFDDLNKKVIFEYFIVFLKKKHTYIISYNNLLIKWSAYFGISGVRLIKIFTIKKNFINLKVKIRSDIFKENFEEIFEKFKEIKKEYE